MISDHTTITDQAVYLVYEHREGSDDAVRLVFEDDAEALREVIDYCISLSNDPATVGPDGEFHAADRGQRYMDEGDWYLVKRHGVGISHGLNQHR